MVTEGILLKLQKRDETIMRRIGMEFFEIETLKTEKGSKDDTKNSCVQAGCTATGCTLNGCTQYYPCS